MKAPTLRDLECNGAWQERVTQFVRRETYHCVSYLISDLVKHPEYSEELMSICIQDDWVNAAADNGWLGVDADDQDSAEEEARYYCDAKNIDPYTIEAYEHWIISDWLADKLIARGEMVIKDFLGLTIWGRCTTGQSIMIDRVINEIYYELVESDLKIESVARELGL